MKKQRNINRESHYTPREYDSSRVGVDDPVWALYTAEAKRWDAQFVEGWHREMDIILLFAALFSAIVTAFLMESYKLLQVDHEEIVASGVPIIINLLQAIAANQPPPAVVNDTNSLTNFQPSRAAFVINSAWFLALTLSISAALLAMLVKRWAEGYRQLNDRASPYVQARWRQARHDKLKRWRTQEIGLALPALLMHTALGLFLLGLVGFLYELNRTILSLVLVVIIFTFTVYFGTTILPLFVAFCPYDTPFSSRKYWALLCAACYRLVSPNNRSMPGQPTLPLRCQLEEKAISESTIPDELTIRTLEWLIGHSDNNTSVDTAIRAISSPSLGMQISEHSDQDSLIKLLVHKFISTFNGTLDQGTYSQNAAPVTPIQLRKAGLYGLALTNITRNIQMQLVSYGNIQGYTTRMHKQLDRIVASITIEEDQAESIERGLSLVASSDELNVAGSGVTCLSSWYTSTTRTAQSTAKWKAMLIQLIEMLSNFNNSGNLKDPGLTSLGPNFRMINQSQSFHSIGRGNTDDGNYDISTTALGNGTMGRVIYAIVTELANWRWDISRQEGQELLEPLVSLFVSPLLNGPFRPGMSAILAILAILFSDHSLKEVAIEPPTANKNEVYTRSPTLEQGVTGNLDEGPRDSYSRNIQPFRRNRRLQLAQYLTRLCEPDNEYVRKNTEALLFFGLAGLLDSTPLLGSTEIARQVIGILTTQLNTMPEVFHTRPILLPPVFPLSIDLRELMVDAITRSISPSPFKGQLYQCPDEDKGTLLECLWGNGYLWSKYGHQLLMPIVQLLHITQSTQLRGHCLVALNKYCSETSHPDQNASAYHTVDWQFLFSLDIPYRLAEIIKEDQTLRPRALETFDSIMQVIPKDSLDSIIGTNDPISTAISRLVMGDLLTTFAEAALCRLGHRHVQTWRDRVVTLPDWVVATTGRQGFEIIKPKLYQFCAENIKKSGGMSILALAIMQKLDVELEQ